MHKLYDIKDALMRELDDYAGQSMHNIETVKCVHMLTDTIKNIDKISMLGGRSERMSHDGYSRDGYANNDGYSERRYSRRGKDHVLDTLGGLMDSADQHERGIIERAMRQLKEL